MMRMRDEWVETNDRVNGCWWVKRDGCCATDRMVIESR